ncbi:MAG: hypothetical protein E7035_08095 [Verrucomicrobiaceae bacterium]|nr:hypothetical protein [Verrucomicrobiaceae bacterium]
MTTYKLSSIIIASVVTLSAWAQTSVNDYTWTNISANAGNTINPSAGTNYKVTGNSKSSGGINVFGYNTGNNEYAAKIRSENADALWIYSGTVKVEQNTFYNSQASKSEKGDVWGAKYLTVLGDSSNGSGPSITGKFRGSALQEDKDAYVYVYGGIYSDKFSAVSNYTAYNSKVAYNGTVSERTGHLIINGGTFNSDITGFGMAQSGNYTANTDIQILGSITNKSGMGVYGGVAGASDGAGNLYGNTNITVSGAGKTSFVVGGNRMASLLKGNAQIDVSNGGTVGAIIGGNYIHDSHAQNSTLDGNVSINVNNANVGTISSTGVTGMDMNGIIGGGVNTTITGNTVVNISGNSQVKGGITAGSASWGETSINKTTLNINGGTITATGNTSLESASIKNAIYAGSLAIGLSQAEKSFLGAVTQFEIYKASNTTITNGTAINVSGGNITGDIFGGGYAQGASDTYYGKMTVNGGTAITVDAKNTLSINGNIYGGGNQGSYGTSTVNGGTNVSFKGNGANLTFTGTVFGSGLNGAVVNGSKVFNFDSFTGAFNGTIANFDDVNVNASDVLFNGAFSNVSNLTIFENSIVTIANSSIINGINLINNGKLVITEIDTSSSTTLKGEAEVKVGESLSIAVNSNEGVTINSITNVAESEAFVEVVSGKDFVAFDAFDFDIDLTAGESVTLSFYVDKEGLSANNFVIYHEENGEWTIANDVSNVKYENGYLTFDVSHFSGYGYTAAVPEPAEWAMVFGAIALAFVAYRRRK